MLFIPSSAEKIADAFQDNNSRELLEVFSPTTTLNISFPEPLPFSDQLSAEQAYFLFRRLFATYKTFSFEVMEIFLSPSEDQGIILKARWSFRNIKNNSPYLFLIFFDLSPEPAAREPAGSGAGKAWRISEIKAERL